MTYEERLEAHKQELLAMGVAEKDIPKIMKLEAETGHSYRESWELLMTQPGMVEDVVDEEAVSDYDF